MSCVLSREVRKTIKGDWGQCAHNPDGGRTTNSKRLIICCDGTWNNANAASSQRTNVSRLATVVAQKCCTGMPQVVYYHRGAGTDSLFAERMLGGIFGTGVVDDIRDVYRFICDNYSPGDEIVMVGFSRGAFTARSVAGMVCSIGLLNGFGLTQFGEIFSDYQDFPNWTAGSSFDEDRHLKAFVPGTFMTSIGITAGADVWEEKGYWAGEDNATVDSWVTFWKEERYNRIRDSAKGETNPERRVEKLSEAYRKLLLQLRMIQCAPDTEGKMGEFGIGWAPEDVKIKAIAVWDTVGSLGIPNASWVMEKLRPGRSASELRFASMNVHRDVEYAFHALALDEWRMAFKSRRSARSGMADQLSSIGVEFVPEEMGRIFRAVDLSVPPHRWALGDISSTPIATSIFDRVTDTALVGFKLLLGKNIHSGTRNPGRYRDDSTKTASRLRNTSELVHPSVRTRYSYLHDGMDKNDRDWPWDCVALTSAENGYRLRRSVESQPAWVTDRYKPGASTYRTLAGDVACVHAHDDTDDKWRKVPRQLPFEQHLKKPKAPSEWDWETARQWPGWFQDGIEEENRYATRWAWEREDRETGRVETLHEERVGVWERLFLETNEKHMRMHIKRLETQGVPDATKKLEIPWPKRTLRERLRNIRKVFKKRARTAVTAPFRLAGRVSEAVVGSIGQLFLGLSRQSERPDLGGRHKDYGYHDFIAWQYGDLRVYTALPTPPMTPPSTAQQGAEKMD
ncbi:hypothetical protein CSOJ01_15002 [Colletotrichum sojae]|uniref:T6SS Phospholipase effector Tle1-like catalytic domain-containing protein n=1 Tax=Colletotrichum sojae TaxID=2175907 RepID=A0A8H6INI6_9PEZI|nr:hypothetical protein CSOJ01_15002 [Colletotrichum sojae]